MHRLAQAPPRAHGPALTRGRRTREGFAGPWEAVDELPAARPSPVARPSPGGSTVPVLVGSRAPFVSGLTGPRGSTVPPDGPPRMALRGSAWLCMAGKSMARPARAAPRSSGAMQSHARRRNATQSPVVVPASRRTPCRRRGWGAGKARTSTGPHPDPKPGHGRGSHEARIGSGPQPPGTTGVTWRDHAAPVSGATEERSSGAGRAPVKARPGTPRSPAGGRTPDCPSPRRPPRCR
jgi:hypothetical protein